MTPLRTDLGSLVPPSFPDTGIGRGWEPAVLAGVTLVLLCFGLVNLYSASSFLAQRQDFADTFYVLRQTAGAAVGLFILVACARVPHGWWRHVAWPLLVATWICLLLLVLPWTQAIAPPTNGARRWLELGISFQPSEIAKLAVIIWTAHLAVKKSGQFRSLTKGLFPFLLVWGITIAPILLQPDLSTAFVVGAAGAITVFAAGARIGHFVALGIGLLPLAVAQLGSGFRLERLIAFRDVEAHATNAGYQIHQSLIALGSGGIAGVGFGAGRQKFGFLPEPHNDFIFSMIGEEWGLLGVAFLLVLYLALVLVGFRIARRAGDPFGELLAIGLTSLIALHAFLHMGVGLGLLPPTGLSLPLVSYGRSNLLVILAAVGMLISIARGSADPGRTSG
ncbi:MAG: putative peptidoglycan glycosyltransferase FtsW [Gemmatimonadota bacterium]